MHLFSYCYASIQLWLNNHSVKNTEALCLTHNIQNKGLPNFTNTKMLLFDFIKIAHRIIEWFGLEGIWKIFLQAEEPQVSQPVFMGEVHQSSEHLCGPLLNSLQQVHVRMLGIPELNTELEVGSHEMQEMSKRFLFYLTYLLKNYKKLKVSI